jgi:ParB-like chromosome segregation protein Spo0J
MLAGCFCGHGRVMAARKLGLSEAPVIVLSHLSPTQCRAPTIAEHQIASNEWWKVGDVISSHLQAASLSSVRRLRSMTHRELGSAIVALFSS